MLIVFIVSCKYFKLTKRPWEECNSQSLLSVMYCGTVQFEFLLDAVAVKHCLLPVLFDPYLFWLGSMDESIYYINLVQATLW